MHDAGNDITRESFGEGYSLYTFNVEPEFEGMNYLTLMKQGDVRIEAHFDTPLNETCMCVVYSESNGYFEINQSRQVVVE